MIATGTLLLVLAVTFAGLPGHYDRVSQTSTINMIGSPPTDSSYVTTFQIQNTSSDASPWLVYPANNNTVWVVAIKLGKPLFSQIINFTMVAPNAGIAKSVLRLNNTIPNDIVYDQNDSRVWIVENDSLAYYNQATKSLTVALTFLNGSPFYLAIDRSNHLWITLLGTDQIVEYDPSTGNDYNYSTPTSNVGLQGIAVSPVDGSIWFAEAYSGKIGRLDPCGAPTSCPITEFSPPAGMDLQGMIQVAVDKNGIVWFTVHDGNEFGSFNPKTGEWKLLPIGYCLDSYVGGCAAGLPNAIALDSLGQVWFSEHIAGRIARYQPDIGTLIEYDLPTSSQICQKSCTPYAWWMWPGPSHLVWFVSFGLGQIGYVNSTVPVPFGVTTQTRVTIGQGDHATVIVLSDFAGTAPSLGASITALDALTNPPMLAWSFGPEQTSERTHSLSSELTISASWDASIGSRNIAVTVYNQNVTENAFVQVNVSPIAYVTIGFAGGISAFAIATMTSSVHSGKKRKTVSQQANNRKSD